MAGLVLAPFKVKLLTPGQFTKLESLYGKFDRARRVTRELIDLFDSSESFETRAKNVEIICDELPRVYDPLMESSDENRDLMVSLAPIRNVLRAVEIAALEEKDRDGEVIEYAPLQGVDHQLEKQAALICTLHVAVEETMVESKKLRERLLDFGEEQRRQGENEEGVEESS